MKPTATRALSTLLLAASLCACASPSTTTTTIEAEEPPRRAAIPTHETMLADLVENSRITILGETHGNKISPETAGYLAEEVLRVQGAVTVGLEIPEREQGRLQSYLEGEGTDRERCLLLDSHFWSPHSADGRSSLAKLELIERLRSLREEGHDVEILAFDRRSGADQQSGEEGLAEAIIEYAQSRPERRLVVLTGNFHARRAPFEFMGSELVPMSSFIGRAVAETTTIKLDYRGGTTLALTHEGFDELLIIPSPREQEGLHGYDMDDGFYDYYWVVERAVPSPPAYRSIGGELNCGM